MFKRVEFSLSHGLELSLYNFVSREIVTKPIAESPTLVTRKTSLLTFKAIHKLAPTYISELESLKDTGGRYYRRSNNGKLLNIPPSKSLSTLGNGSFYMAAPKLWNDLPLLLEIYRQLMLSRRLLKLIYFERHFPVN